MAKQFHALVPDYFPSFQCKCGACRATCCSGWGICISMEEYFHLLGMDCSPALRRRLDGAFHVLHDATPARYAQVNPSWQGNCPLQREDGYCALQCECGAEALPQVCRAYPRGLRTAFQPECSCANSCEGVLELLLHRETPLGLIPYETDQRLSVIEAPEPPADALRDREIRDSCIALLEERGFPLPVRILRLGRAVDAARRQQQMGASHDVILATIQAALEDSAPLPVTEGEDSFPLSLQCALLILLAKDSRSLGEETERVLETLGLSGEELPDPAALQSALPRYRAAEQRFGAAFPQWERFFEGMLVNHVIFSGFPYSGRHEGLAEEYMALCAVYALLRCMAVLWMDTHSGEDALVDICAATFRLVEHSEFTWNAPIVFRRCGVTALGELERLLLGC